MDGTGAMCQSRIGVRDYWLDASWTNEEIKKRRNERERGEEEDEEEEGINYVLENWLLQELL